MNIDSATTFLNGYLHSLRRLTKNRCDFWAECFEVNASIDTDINERLRSENIAVCKIKAIGYAELEKIIDLHILSKLDVKDNDILKQYAWDVIENMELTFRMIEPEVNPISDKQLLAVQANSEFHGDYIYLILPVRNYVVSIGLANRVQQVN